MSKMDKAEKLQPDLEPGVEVATKSQQDTNVPYSIYTKNQKRMIILAASIASFFSPMGSNIYIPALNSVAEELHVSDSLITLTLTTYLVCTTLLLSY